MLFIGTFEKTVDIDDLSKNEVNSLVDNGANIENSVVNLVGDTLQLLANLAITKTNDYTEIFDQLI